MTDYKEEQRNEIEALESIYPEEIEVLCDDPYIFTVEIKADGVKEDPSAYMTLKLKFSYVPTYPDELPLIEIDDSENVSEEDIAELLTFLQDQANANLGMVMVFTLVSEAVEWLNIKLQKTVVQKIEEEELKIKKFEEEEQRKFEGTRVTVESFLSWKAMFDQEIAELRKMQNKEVLSKKLTGRELFEKDRTLIDSDLQFLQEGEEEVKVDESLFQEMDDLELDEDLADDSS